MQSRRCYTGDAGSLGSVHCKSKGYWRERCYVASKRDSRRGLSCRHYLWCGKLAPVHLMSIVRIALFIPAARLRTSLYTLTDGVGRRTDA